MVCAFTGYRPGKFAFGYRETDPACVRLKALLRREIEQLLQRGVNHFLCGMAMGSDLWCAEALLSLRRAGRYSAALEAILPCPGQANAWPPSWQRRYRAVLAAADRQVVVSPEYTRACMNLRNRYLVDHSDLLFAVFSGKPGGTRATVDYAARLGRDIILVQPEDLQVLHLTKPQPPEQLSLD